MYEDCLKHWIWESAQFLYRTKHNMYVLYFYCLLNFSLLLNFYFLFCLDIYLVLLLCLFLCATIFTVLLISECCLSIIFISTLLSLDLALEWQGMCVTISSLYCFILFFAKTVRSVGVKLMCGNYLNNVT